MEKWMGGRWGWLFLLSPNGALVFPLDHECIFFFHTTCEWKGEAGFLFQPLYSKRYVSFSHLHTDRYNWWKNQRLRKSGGEKKKTNKQMETPFAFGDETLRSDPPAASVNHPWKINTLDSLVELRTHCGFSLTLSILRPVLLPSLPFPHSSRDSLELTYTERLWSSEDFSLPQSSGWRREEGWRRLSDAVAVTTSEGGGGRSSGEQQQQQR